MNKPIITSLLDTDLYKFKMLYFLWKMGLTETKVRYQLYNRSNINLTKYIDKKELSNQINNLFSLNFSYDELKYLETLFEPEFVSWLSKKELGPISYSSWVYNLYYTGKIGDIILYETPIMAIVNYLYRQGASEVIQNFTTHEDEILDFRLNNKIDYIKENRIHEKCNIIEFGSRRRVCIDFQKFAIKRLYDEGIIKGTSNVLLSKELGIPCYGTIAHEMYMLYAALIQKTNTKSKNAIEESQIVLVKDWNKIFPETYHLTDTYGSEWFFNNIILNQTNILYGVRQDSGDPHEFMKLLNKFNMTNKRVMFSDGLTAEKMKELSFYSIYYDISFGWGTNLTNDGLVKPISIVVKLSNVNDSATVKLSDNPSKHMGGNNIDYYKEIFNYPNNVKFEECVY